jgi:hypothetical protein
MMRVEAVPESVNIELERHPVGSGIKGDGRAFWRNDCGRPNLGHFDHVGKDRCVWESISRSTDQVKETTANVNGRKLRIVIFPATYGVIDLDVSGSMDERPQRLIPDVKNPASRS